MCEIEDLGVGLEEGGLGILRKFEDIGAKKKKKNSGPPCVCVCQSGPAYVWLHEPIYGEGAN